jgi:hypothetical protein
LVRHEQGAAFAAGGYARASGQPGVAIATSGPGATNLVTGIADAKMDGVPLVCLTGQVRQAVIGTDAFQETDVVGLTLPVTKWNCMITDIRDIPRLFAQAFYVARTGRPGPVFVPAVLRLADRREVAEMPTSTGTLRRMERVGNLEFTLGGEMLTLGAFVEYGTQRIESLFVPFADLTTGEETYDAGRYLDIEPTASGLYTIDFNYAYNPNCAYSDLYECPFPPPSNRLKVAIQAGEKAPGA